jgi:hypothetical protein
MEKTLYELATTYVDTRIKMTNCMNKRFKQLCNRCGSYTRCTIYAEYVDSWIGLESYIRTHKE